MVIRHFCSQNPPKTTLYTTVYPGCIHRITIHTVILYNCSRVFGYNSHWEFLTHRSIKKVIFLEDQRPTFGPPGPAPHKLGAKLTYFVFTLTTPIIIGPLIFKAFWEDHVKICRLPCPIIRLSRTCPIQFTSTQRKPTARTILTATFSSILGPEENGILLYSTNLDYYIISSGCMILYFEIDNIR